MNFFLFVALVISSSLTWAQSNSMKLQSLQQIKRLAFGSCNKQYEPQPLWNELIKLQPDLFIWGGDNIYANTHLPHLILESYQVQNARPDYRHFKSFTPFIGTWDDHDFAFDNANGAYKYKSLSQKAFLDFMEEPHNSPRRSQEGVYTSYEFGDGEQKIKIILLDNRYYKDVSVPAPLLGEKQWRWLEEELKNSQAALNFIVSGLSVLSPRTPFSEEWADYPNERLKLFQLIKKYSPRGVVLLTGDKHFGSIFNHSQSSLSLIEFMSSGMTHVARRPLHGYIKRNFPSPILERHVGLIDIFWEKDAPVIEIFAWTDKGRKLNTQKYKWKNKRWYLQ